ncbi:MAG: FxsA family protein [Methylococcales bacterium]|nr:FxsA family protein [Methylococcales bacterium]
MKNIQILFLCVLIIPFAEIYLLLLVGGIIGVLPTILLVVFTAVLGTYLLKQQGLATFKRFQESLAQGAIPAYEMVEGPIILVGGALLLTPGFFTDALGFACLIPNVRRKIAQYVIENYLVQPDGSVYGTKPRQADVLEGEFRRED